jgi:hypothetical protein
VSFDQCVDVESRQEAAVEHIASGAWILFAGAGVSASAGLPTGPQLVERIEDALGLACGTIPASQLAPHNTVRSSRPRGAYVLTLPFAVLEQLIKHPLTDIGVRKFLDDWAKSGSGL